MVAFTSPLPRLYFRDFMTAGEKEQAAQKAFTAVAFYIILRFLNYMIY